MQQWLHRNVIWEESWRWDLGLMVSFVPRALQSDTVAKGMKIHTSRQLGRVVEPEERACVLRSIGDRKFYEFAKMPLAALSADAAVNPKFIAEYTFPGVITGFSAHLEYIKLVP